jgi:hypothetical protein
LMATKCHIIQFLFSWNITFVLSLCQALNPSFKIFTLLHILSFYMAQLIQHIFSKNFGIIFSITHTLEFTIYTYFFQMVSFIWDFLPKFCKHFSSLSLSHTHTHTLSLSLSLPLWRVLQCVVKYWKDFNKERWWNLKGPHTQHFMFLLSIRNTFPSSSSLCMVLKYLTFPKNYKIVCYTQGTYMPF